MAVKIKKNSMVLLFITVLCWMMMGSFAMAASSEAPVLEYFYYDGGTGEGESQLMAASLQTGGQELSGAVLLYEKADGTVGRLPAAETAGGVAAFLSENVTIQKSQLVGVIVGFNGQKYTIDLKDFQNASDTMTAQVPEDQQAAKAVENMVADSAGEISSALRAAEQSASPLKSRSFRSGTGLNKADGDIVVVLDPGHGGYEGGASRTWDGVTYIEKEITLKISKYTKAELEKYAGVRVYLTRTGDVDMSLEERVNYAAKMGATVLVSQHINSTPQQQSTATGAEVMVSSGNYRPAQAEETANIARTILAELEKIGFKNRDLVYKFSETGDTYPNGKLADYYGIVRRSVLAGFPGMIAEHGFVSNPEDCLNYYSSNAKIKRLGVADATAIARYYGLQKKNLAGWNKEGNNWYYMNANGERVPSGWLNLGNLKYYLDDKGYRVTGWRTIGSRRYYFNSDGIMQTGLLKYEGKFYWFTTKGVLKKGFFLGSDGNYRYANSKGVLYTGWKTYRGNKYYFRTDTGAALKEWYRFGKYYYYFSPAGKMQTGMITINGKKYFLRSSGVRAKGIVTYRNRKYYFDGKTGAMVKSKWVKSKNKWYFFSKYGYAYRNRTKKISGKKYKFDAKGVCTNRRR